MFGMSDKFKKNDKFKTVRLDEEGKRSLYARALDPSDYRQLKAKMDFGDVNKGDLGGFVYNEWEDIPRDFDIIQLDDDSWVYDDAVLGKDATLENNSTLRGYSDVYNTKLNNTDVIHSTVHGGIRVNKIITKGVEKSKGEEFVNLSEVDQSPLDRDIEKYELVDVDEEGINLLDELNLDHEDFKQLKSKSDFADVKVGDLGGYIYDREHSATKGSYKVGIDDSSWVYKGSVLGKDSHLGEDSVLLKDSFCEDANIKSSRIDESRVISSTLNNSEINGSTLINVSESVDSSNVINSRIDAAIYINSSEIKNCDVIKGDKCRDGAAIEGSILEGSSVNGDSLIAFGSNIASSEFNQSTAISSSITGSTFTNASAKGSNVSDSIFTDVAFEDKLINDNNDLTLKDVDLVGLTSDENNLKGSQL